MTQLHRPTLHQIYALQWEEVGAETAYTYIAGAVEHVASALAPEAAQDLRDQLAPERRPSLYPRDVRRPLVRSLGLLPVPGCEPLCVAFFAYQDGTGLLLHFIWHWDGTGDATTFQALRDRLWIPPSGEFRSSEVSETTEVSHNRPAGDLGAGLLLTAALPEPLPDSMVLAGDILTPFQTSETTLTRVSLSGTTLYVRLPESLHLAPWWPAVLLFDRPEIEESLAADEFATVAWPLVVLYHLRLERLYLDQYRREVAPALENHFEKLSRTLEASFAPQTRGAEGSSAPRLLARSDLGEMRRALTNLSGPQYGLLEALSAAERCAHDARRDLRNLEGAVRSSLTLSLSGSPSAPEEIETSAAALTYRARHDADQMEADASEARNLAERAARAVDVLRTQADILEAGYEQRLNITVAVLGIALAAGQLVSDDLAAWLWESVGHPVWPSSLAPLAAPVLEHLLMRLAVMLIAGLFTWLLVSLYSRLER